MAAVNITDLTTGDVNGDGIFDKLMAAAESHIVQEYQKNRIKGPEYSTVYLGAMQAAMDRALQFLLEKQRTDLEAQLLEVQIENANKEGVLLDKQADKLDTEIEVLQAQLLNIPKEGLVLDGQKCKLDAEFDLLMEQKLKAIAETALLSQKKVTEQAQTSGTGVDADSVIGKQKALYVAQTAGFQRDAEQKAAKIMVDTWNARRMTDDTTEANIDNGLLDENVKRAITQLLSGVNA